MWRLGSKITQIIRNRALLLVVRLVIAGIFIYASWEKILYPGAFVEIIKGYPLDPIINDSMAGMIAIWLAWTELAGALALLLGIWPRAMGLLFSFLMVVFIAGLAQALGRGIDIRCGCFDLSPEAAARDWASLWQEGLLLLACLWVWLGHWPPSRRQAAPAEELAPM